MAAFCLASVNNEGLRHMDNDAQNRKDQSCDDKSPGEEIIETPSRERESCQKEKSAKSKFKQWCDLDVDRQIESGAAVIGLVVGLLVACIAVKQLNAIREQADVMNNQLTEMKAGSADTQTIARSAKTQADNTKKLADTTEILAKATQSNVAQAKAALGATIEFSRLDKRAWVGLNKFASPSLDDGGTKKYIKEGSRPVFRVFITNFGKTPARNMQNLIDGRALLKGAPFEPDYRLEGTVSNSVLSPGAEGIMDTNPPPHPLTAKQVEAFTTGEQVLYVYGKITYDDIFDVKHETTFCGYLASDLASFITCSTYNNAN